MNIYIYNIYIYIYTSSSSSSSSYVPSMDFSDSLSPYVPIIHRSLPVAYFPNYILCLHRANVDMFLLAGQCWYIYM